jgi:hypothetical protein
MSPCQAPSSKPACTFPISPVYANFTPTFFSDPVMASDHRFCAFRVGPGKVLLLFQRGSDPAGTKLAFGFIPAHHTAGQSHIGFIPADSLPAWRAHLQFCRPTAVRVGEWLCHNRQVICSAPIIKLTKPHQVGNKIA